MQSRSAFRGALAWVVSRFRNRPDREHEMVINRLVIAVLILAYLLTAATIHPHSVHEPLMVSIVFATLAIGLFLDMLIRPGASVVRRLLAMTLDLVALSYGMHVGEGVTALLYPMYLWTIFGNGFRFGIRYLRIATAIAVVGFSVVIYETDYWRANLALAIGLLVGLIILPLYAGSLIRKLSEATRLAENASRAKSLFLAGVSHELRTPLNAVIGMSDLLRDTRLDAEQQDMAGTIGTSARGLLGLINQILDFSRIEAGRMPIHNIDFDLHAALAEVKAMVSPQARAKGLQFGLHVSPRVPYRLHGDKRHLQDILINLVSNAVKFTENGSVVLRGDLASAEDGRSRLRLEVTDTGIGIHPDATSRIFESFTQADETIINRFGGTGLGLAICKQLAEMMGGAIGVASEVGVGSTFWLELEFNSATDLLDKPQIGSMEVIVLSRDEALARAVFGRFADTGATVALANDEDEAKQLLMRAAEAAARSLLLVDEQMGGWDTAVRNLNLDSFSFVATALVRDHGGDELLPVALQTIFVAGISRQCEQASLFAVANMARGQMHAPGSIGKALAQSSSRSLSILVAEDNGVNQKVVRKILERGGHRVTLADNGEHAVDLLLMGGFELVLMDINMPVMNGIEATKLYRFAALGRERVPIIALTADVTPEAFEQCLQAGMDAVLPKPIEPAELFAAVERLTAGVPTATALPATDDKITDIAAHPKFRSEIRSPIDSNTIRELENLGGREFVSELAHQFLEEGGRIVEELRDAVRREDVLHFRDRLHALRSSAANIGARGLYETCLGLRTLDGSEFAARGAERVSELEAEFVRVEKSLRDYCSGERAVSPASAAVAQFARKPV